VSDPCDNSDLSLQRSVLLSRRLAAATFVTALAAAGISAPHSTADPGPGGFASPNVTWVANVPLDAPAIGGRVLTVGGQRRFYVSGTKGLSIYDVSNPALPVPLGTLANPHFENESVAVSDDGKTVLLASDPGFGQPPLTYVVDTSLVTAPHVVSVIPDGSHTVTCANAKCDYVYGSYGWIYDIRDRANPRSVGKGPGATHYATRDAAGLLWDSVVVLDPRKDPEHPTRRVIGTGGWHNNMRPNAEKWKPRKASDRSALLKPGELVLGGDETWLAPGHCNKNSAAVTSWSVANFDKGGRAVRLASLTPVNGDLTNDGNPPADAVGCSSHWFDYRNGMIAAGWYDHGTRFIKVNERTGALAEVGFYQPGVTETWGAYWVDDQYVYTVDAVRGIDILKVNRLAPAATPAQRASSWSAPRAPLTAFTRRELYVCRPRGE
jgi:hypothetical protein